MSIEWLLARAQSAAAGKGTSQTDSRGAASSGQARDAESIEPAQDEPTSPSPTHFQGGHRHEGIFLRWLRKHRRSERQPE